MKGTVKFRALSWREHVAAGHTPFRKDCLVCQQASAKDQHHRRSKLPPRAGVLSLDLSGPFHVAPDLHRKTAKYLLVGAFTWLAPNQGGDDFEDLEIPEVPAEAPELDDPEEAPLPELRDEDDVWGEVQEERAEREAERKKQERQEQKANEDQPEKGGEEGEEEGEVEERKTPKIVVTRLCLPIQSKRQHDVLRGIIDLYLRLRSDGYRVTQIHTDRGGEFTQEALDRWCASRSILHTTTAGDQPQSNGRAEVSVQWVKAEIRRILHAAGAPFSRWPLAARNLNERLRLKQIGKPAVVPNFLEPVLIRKRFWRTMELLPTQEKALYLSPSWVHHGHWIEREDGSIALTRMVMHRLQEPPKDQDWIGLEDQLAPTEVRQRIRGKVSLNHLSFGEAAQEEDEKFEGGGKNEEELKEEEIRKTRRIIEDEMKFAMEDDTVGSFLTVDAIASIKELTASTTPEEVLQTKIVAQHEVRKNLPDWIDPIKAELTALFETKKALRPIDTGEVHQLVAEGKAEILPSKMVWTVKPSPTDKKENERPDLWHVETFNQGEDQPDSLFAGGATGVALRASMAMASQFAWHGTVLDIKTAFLNAPMKLGATGAGNDEDAPLPKKAIIKPPPMLIMAGLAKPDEYWEVVMALYGYKESPKLWSDYRDDQLALLKIPAEDQGWLVLDQMITEPNMWKIMKQDPGPFGTTRAEQLVGLLLVYVDDLLILGEPSSISATSKPSRRNGKLRSLKR